MRRQYLNALAIEFLVVIIALFQFFILKNFNYYIYLAILLAVNVIYTVLFKIDIRSKMQSKELLLMVLISCMAYYIIQYAFGFATGFVYTTFSKTITGILYNVLTAIAFIALSENLRNIVLDKAKYYKSVVFLCPIAFTMLELVTQISIGQLSTKSTILQIIMMVVVPTLCKNIFLTFLTYHSGRFNSMVYQFFMTIPMYLLPIFPDFGDYINSILKIGFPIATLLISARVLFYKREGIKDSKSYFKTSAIEKAITIIGIVLLLSIVYLISDRGTFYAMAIGSNSMEGVINKGDVVIINKTKKTYKEGDILAVDVDGVMIVHRVVKVTKVEGGYTYQTKGDANNGEDWWEVKESMIKGKAVFAIKYIGWPTIKLSEFLQQK